MPGSQIAGVSDFGDPEVSNGTGQWPPGEEAGSETPAELHMPLDSGKKSLEDVMDARLEKWICIGKTQLPPQPLSLLQKVLCGFIP